MRDVPLNKEARIHRLLNQRRIGFSLIERARTLLKPGIPFARELHEMFRAQGNFGSKDRRLYRELVYSYLRYQPWLDTLRSDQEEFMNALIRVAAPTQEIQSLYPTLPPTAPALDLDAPRAAALGREVQDLLELLPDWYETHCARPCNPRSLAALFTRPPLWLRVQRDPDESLVDDLRTHARPEQAAQIYAHPEIHNCIHAPADYSIATHPRYVAGDVEVQDITSQLLLQLTAAPLSGHWLDICAGAGGKTLQLASYLKPFGKVDAYDPRSSALRELHARVKRSPLRNINILKQRPTRGQYAGVLVDAPCSGSGTWRRHPYLLRQTREKDVFAYAETQLAILRENAPLLAPGGLLLYSTCSLSRHENERVQQRFLESHPDFEAETLADRFGHTDHGKGITLYPEDHDGDALYIAALRKKA